MLDAVMTCEPTAAGLINYAGRREATGSGCLYKSHDLEHVIALASRALPPTATNYLLLPVMDAKRSILKSTTYFLLP